MAPVLRRGDNLVEIQTMNGHVSPRRKVKFEMGNDGLRINCPDGGSFVTYLEPARQCDQERRRADEAKQQADEAKQRADQFQAERERLRREARPPGA